MKTIIFILLLLPAIVFSQNLTGRQTATLYASKTSQFFIAGMWEGAKDATDHHYNRVKALLPFLNDQYFNNDLSWRNKHLNGDPDQGPAFPLATGPLVSLTDFWHHANYKRTKHIVISAVIPLWTKPDLKDLAIQLVSYTIAFNAGKALVNDVIF